MPGPAPTPKPQTERWTTYRFRNPKTGAVVVFGPFDEYDARHTARGFLEKRRLEGERWEVVEEKVEERPREPYDQGKAIEDARRLQTILDEDRQRRGDPPDPRETEKLRDREFPRKTPDPNPVGKDLDMIYEFRIPSVPFEPEATAPTMPMVEDEVGPIRSRVRSVMG